MMTTWIVTRHIGAQDFLKSQGISGIFMPHLDIDVMQSGDKVVGNLPLHLISALNLKGIEYWHLCINQPLDDRGQEHSDDYLYRVGATLKCFHVHEVT